MENELAGRKAKFFKDSNTSVHVSLANGRFYNGNITYIGADFILVNDFKFGEVCAFFVEIEDILPFKRKEE